MHRLTEVRFSAEPRVDLEVLNVLAAVVVGDAAPQMLQVAPERAIDGLTHRRGVLGGKLTYSYLHCKIISPGSAPGVNPILS